MVKSNGTLVNNKYTPKETNNELLFKRATLKVIINSLEFLTGYPGWLSRESNFAKYLGKW